MMNRLIDTMTDAAIDEYISYLSYVNQRLDSPRQKLEKLFAPAPHWSDNLGKEDNQTWEFCFVSDHYPADTRQAKWIARAADLNGGYRDCVGVLWKYATPIDLDLRYGNGEDTL
tara:strand:+ start:906 stop:1247 length:342 start_codon:yes stop_codon:yes gene_type:complete